MRRAHLRFLDVREASVALMLVAVAVYLSFASDYFLAPRNLLNVGRQASVVGMVALGQALVIIARGIDLSVGSVIGLSAVAGAIVARETGIDGLSLPVAAIVGLACGLFNGLLYTKLRINPFIATLGTLSIARGIALLLTGGLPVPLAGPAEFLGAGRLGGIPVSLIIMLVLAAVFVVIAGSTRFGREVFAIGDNPKASRLAGIPLDWVRLRVFAISGMLAGFGGIILAGNLASADPNLGLGYELDVIAAVILGGTSLSGGRGSIPGVILGAVLMALLNNAFVLLGISAYWQVVTKGVVIILAVGLDSIRRDKSADD
ncbi:ABC transporter permease [Mangrovicella endophytica]|uniref:ABC transporter permease n=1 Tax=Mangrovicella endophytica TaxID=2066697 RepID=UPI000C9DB01D|nr:ABC transporter permease [Mangrovicella endophytica]